MNDTIRILAAIFILGGILLLGYSGISYAITYARTTTYATVEPVDNQLPTTADDAAIANRDDDHTWSVVGGAASLAIGIGLLFIPRRLGTNVAKKTRYHTQYRT